MSVEENTTKVHKDDEEVRIHLIDDKTGEPLLEKDGSPVILSPETSRSLIEGAEKDGISLEEKLTQVLEWAIENKDNANY